MAPVRKLDPGLGTWTHVGRVLLCEDLPQNTMYKQFPPVWDNATTFRAVPDVCGPKQGGGARAWVTGKPPQRKDAVQRHEHECGYKASDLATRRSCNQAITLGGLSPKAACQTGRN